MFFPEGLENTPFIVIIFNIFFLPIFQIRKKPIRTLTCPCLQKTVMPKLKPQNPKTPKPQQGKSDLLIKFKFLKRVTILHKNMKQPNEVSRVASEDFQSCKFKWFLNDILIEGPANKFQPVIETQFCICMIFLSTLIEYLNKLSSINSVC